MDTPVRRRKRAVIIVLVATALTLMALVPVVNRLFTAELSVVGIDEGATVNSVALRDAAVVAVGGQLDMSKVDVLVDGVSAEVRPGDDGRLVLARPSLADGPHVITARQRATIPLMPDREVSRRFTVDDSAPSLFVDAAQVKDMRAALTFSGRASGVVAFRDPILARASWNSGNKQRVVQTADGRPWSGSYGQYAFTNYADADVVRYNTDLAVEAADLGFDDILYDYVRRPEGQLGQMRTPGFTGEPTDAILLWNASCRYEPAGLDARR